MEVKIKKDSDGVGGTRIFLDGQEVHRVSRMELVHEVGMMPKLTLEILPQTLEVDLENGEVVTIDKKKKDGYIDFVRFMFRGKYGVTEEKDEN